MYYLHLLHDSNILCCRTGLSRLRLPTHEEEKPKIRYKRCGNQHRAPQKLDYNFNHQIVFGTLKKDPKLRKAHLLPKFETKKIKNSEDLPTFQTLSKLTSKIYMK